MSKTSARVTAVPLSPHIWTQCSACRTLYRLAEHHCCQRVRHAWAVLAVLLAVCGVLSGFLVRWGAVWFAGGR